MLNQERDLPRRSLGDALLQTVKEFNQEALKLQDAFIAAIDPLREGASPVDASQPPNLGTTSFFQDDSESSYSLLNTESSADPLSRLIPDFSKLVLKIVSELKNLEGVSTQQLEAKQAILAEISRESSSLVATLFEIVRISGARVTLYVDSVAVLRTLIDISGQEPDTEYSGDPRFYDKLCECLEVLIENAKIGEAAAMVVLFPRSASVLLPVSETTPPEALDDFINKRQPLILQALSSFLANTANILTNITNSNVTTPSMLESLTGRCYAINVYERFFLTKRTTTAFSEPLPNIPSQISPIDTPNAATISQFQTLLSSTIGQLMGLQGIGLHLAMQVLAPFPLSFKKMVISDFRNRLPDLIRDETLALQEILNANSPDFLTTEYALETGHRLQALKNIRALLPSRRGLAPLPSPSSQQKVHMTFAVFREHCGGSSREQTPFFNTLAGDDLAVTNRAREVSRVLTHMPQDTQDEAKLVSQLSQVFTERTAPSASSLEETRAIASRSAKMYTNTGLAKPMVIAEAAILMMFKLSLQLRAIEEVASAAKIAAEFFSESNHELSGALTELARAIDSSTDSLTKSDQKKNLQSRLRVEPILSWLNSY